MGGRLPRNRIIRLPVHVRFLDTSHAYHLLMFIVRCERVYAWYSVWSRVTAAFRLLRRPCATGHLITIDHDPVAGCAFRTLPPMGCEYEVLSPYVYSLLCQGLYPLLSMLHIG